MTNNSAVAKHAGRSDAQKPANVQMGNSTADDTTSIRFEGEINKRGDFRSYYKPGFWAVCSDINMRYAIVIEKATGSNFSAYVPDLPGCVATSATREEVVRLMREAIAFHLDGMRGDGLPIPEPTTLVDYAEVA